MALRNARRELCHQTWQNRKKLQKNAIKTLRDLLGIMSYNRYIFEEQPQMRQIISWHFNYQFSKSGRIWQLGLRGGGVNEVVIRKAFS